MAGMNAVPQHPYPWREDRKHTACQHREDRTLSKQVHEPLGFLVEPNDNKGHGFVYRKKRASAFSGKKGGGIKVNW